MLGGLLLKMLEVVEKATHYSAILLGFSLSTASFMYVVMLELVHLNLPSSQWMNLIHLSIVSGVLFLLALSSGIVSQASSTWKGFFGWTALALFTIGLIFMFFVLAFLWVESKV